MNDDMLKRIDKIQHHLTQALIATGLDLNDPNLVNTPQRVSKMWINELFSGCHPQNRPSVSFYPYESSNPNQIIQIRDIRVQSCCAHHLLPFYGKAQFAYIPNQRLIGLSKINRIIDYYARRPQLQERLTREIIEDLKNLLDTDHIALQLECNHMCMSLRGVRDDQALTLTQIAYGDLSEQATILFSSKEKNGRESKPDSVTDNING